MRWLIATPIGRMHKQDILNEINNKTDNMELERYVRLTIIMMPKLINVSKEDFEEILKTYRLKHTQITKNTNYYKLDDVGISELIDEAKNELKINKGNTKAIENAINFVLKYFPNNYEALSFKQRLEKVKNK